MEKKLQVHTLPTGKATHLYRIADSWMYSVVNKSYDDNMGHFTYWTTDEEIKEGDWYLMFMDRGDFPDLMQCKDKEEANRCNTHYSIAPICKKIVATDNPEFWHIKAPARKNGMRPDVFIPSGIFKIPTSFLEYFVEKQGIKEVIVEYYDEDNSFEGFRMDDFSPLKRGIKLSPQGEVIWKPVEQKMYTRDDMFNAVEKAYNKHRDFMELDDLIEWFNKDYPKEA